MLQTEMRCHDSSSTNDNDSIKGDFAAESVSNNDLANLSISFPTRFTFHETVPPPLAALFCFN